MALTCDVLVFGGGMAAATAARGCAAAGASVVMAAAETARPELGECLAPEARVEMSRLHPGLDLSAHAPYVGTRSAWSAGELLERSFIFNPFGPGLRLDRPALDAALLCSARSAGVLTLKVGRRFTAERRADRWDVAFQGEGKAVRIDACFVMDATGRAAAFARSQGVRRTVDDPLVALSLRSPAIADDGRLTVVAASYGWWYRVTTPAGTSVVTLVTEPALVRAMGLRAPGRLAALGRVAPGGSRTPSVAPASPSRLERCSGPGWCAVGDAANTWDPLNSQGLPRAMQDGRDAARAFLAGDWAAYDTGRHAAYVEHLNGRARYYGANPRWRDSRFWSRRSRLEGLALAGSAAVLSE